MPGKPALFLAAALFLHAQGASLLQAQPAAEHIRAEATRPNQDPAGRALPLACSWTCGHFPADTSAGWRPENQMRLIEKGHHLLPWFSHPPLRGEVPDDPSHFLLKYYKGPIETARRLKLPLTFIASQWESGLSGKPTLDLAAEKNPNVVTADGKILRKVSPFGPVAPWRAIGRSHTDNPWMRQLQKWYPDPPRVIFLSNNEHSKLRWREVERSKRYLARYGKGRDDDFKRKVVGDGWIQRYRALQAGMRDGLTEKAWKNGALFAGYNVLELAHLGRWGGWGAYALHTAGRIAPGALMWDGASPSYYTHDWNPSTDCTVWSPQIEFMNLVFVLEEAYRLNPRLWFEFSVWDGYDGPKRGKAYPSPRTLYRMKGQTYDPKRYAGFVQFGMWLLRPRAVRDFRGWTSPWEDKGKWEGGGPYFLAIVGAVDRVHRSPILKQWWRKGRLVPNRARKHVYQTGIPKEYKNADRWFLLDAGVNPQEHPWELFWNVPVFALALVQGEAPSRRWLVYTHAPMGRRKGVKLTIPGYRAITVDVSPAGSFYRVAEKPGTVTAVRDGPDRRP